MSKNDDVLTEPPVLIYEKENAGVESAEGQCDACAASVSVSYQSIPLSTKSLYVLAIPFWTVPIATDYEATLLERSSTPVVLNHSSVTVARHFSQPRLLKDIPLAWSEMRGQAAIQSTLEQMISLGLLVPEGNVAPVFTEIPNTLTAWLHITDRCNLRCAYCYLPHIRADMSIETGRAAIEATFRSAVAHNYHQVKLKYAGGEPLLRFPVISKLHQYARKLADQNGLSLDGVVLSNGTLLTPEIVKEMQSLNLRLMISLDGLGETHDRQRFYANGRGSVDHATGAVKLALSYDMVPDISVTVSGRNVDGLPELISWILDRDLPFSLNFYRENDLSASHVDLRLEEEKIIAGILAAYKVIEADLPSRSLLASLVDRATLATPHLRTCGVGHSYLVFDYKGQVSKCQMQMNKPVTNAHADDPLALIRADKIGIQNISVNEKEGCRSCEWKYWCAGGCSLMTYKATGRYDVKSPNCNIYKALYPEVVRLEGLRLLKYSAQNAVG